jgi:sensor c-di-GMP phosphodiesterase-like protein
MPTFKLHFLATLAAMIIAAALGTWAGYLLARHIAVKAAESQLAQYAERLLLDEEATSAELHTVLAAVSASRYKPCSNAEIDSFRTRIFASEYLKDAGRMHNGQIECSAALGQPAQPSAQSIPDFTQQDGVTLYKNLAPYKNSGLNTITWQFGDSFVAFTPLSRLHLEPAPMHFSETMTDAPTQTHGRLLGEPLQASERILTSEGSTRIGDNLYATRCSPHALNCITAYTTIPEVVQANRTKFFVCVFLFRLLGGLTGLAFSLLYSRYKSTEQQLRRAIRGDKLTLVYQPIVQLTSGRITGAEALVRWTNEEGLAVIPEAFVRLAERRGFVGEITRLVVRQALRDFREIFRSHPEFRLSINVAAADLADPTFLFMLDASLREAAVPAQCLAIEITEGSTVMRDAAIKTIRGLHERGCSVHIDDFGTGYSSLSYLQDLSVDAIKIDRSFTQTIGTGAVIVAILPQILAMAEALSLKVIVEGVETYEQVRYFASATLPMFAQGWLFGRPVPADQFRRLLAEDEKKALASDYANSEVAV